MKIKKTYQGVVPTGKVLNAQSNSQNDTYSCDYINKNKENYSTEEQVIGTWIDGKTLYRKMVDFGSLPSNGQLDVLHNISNVSHIHVNLGKTFWCPNGQSYTGQGNCFTCVYTSFISGVYVNQNAMSISTVSPDASNFKMLMCLEYTKTTD